MKAPWAVLIASVSALLGAGCVNTDARVGVRRAASPRRATPAMMSFAAEPSHAQAGLELPTAVRTSFVASEPPPAPTSQPREFVPRRPAREAIWLEGHWAYTNDRNEPYEWLPGHWEIPPSGRGTWIPDAWRQRDKGWIYVRGHWQ